MTLIVYACIILCLTSVMMPGLNRYPRSASLLAVAGTSLASLLCVPVILQVLRDSSSLLFHFDLALPFARGTLGVDPLSAIFLIPIVLLSPVAAVYGSAYMRHDDGHSQFKAGTSWFFYLLLIASMILVVIARDGILFLIAWEVMSLSSFFLVLSNHEDQTVRTAGIHYLIAAHISAACLFVLFILLGTHTDSYSFSMLADAGGRNGTAVLSCIFLLAVAGFGIKAGFVPFHVWLPEAHPAAPSHVSALMSGVMIKTGIYGLLRILLFISPPPAWWGIVLIGIGLLSALGGILFAMAQHDIKRVLAYHSVENIGIITIGIGAGMLGITTGSPLAAGLGFSAALLHTINHALFKAGLFMGAGAVIVTTRTHTIDCMGGLMKPMRWTALTFLICAIAITGLPPLNGFISELLLYSWGLSGLHGTATIAASSLSVIIVLALVGGLTAACLSKVFAGVFLGQARNDACRHAREVPWQMRIPMAVCAAGCVLIGLAALPAVRCIMPAVSQMTGGTADGIYAPGTPQAAALGWTSIFGVALIVMSILIALLRWLLLRRRVVRKQETWGCGFKHPGPRMQYTATSFIEPITGLFSMVLRTIRTLTLTKNLFPGPANYETETPDTVQNNVYRRLYLLLRLCAGSVRRFQHGAVQVYILYIFITLLSLLIWKLK